MFPIDLVDHFIDQVGSVVDHDRIRLFAELYIRRILIRLYGLGDRVARLTLKITRKKHISCRIVLLDQLDCTGVWTAHPKHLRDLFLSCHLLYDAIHRMRAQRRGVVHGLVGRFGLLLGRFRLLGGWVCAVSCADCFSGMVDCPAGKTNTNAPMLTIASNKAHNSEILRFIAFPFFLCLFFAFYYTIPGYVVL